LERDKAKLEKEIKKYAKQNEVAAVKNTAKTIVQAKNGISRLRVMRSNVMALGIKMQTMKTQHDMGKAMGKLTKSMKKMNKKMNIQSLSKLIQEYEVQNQKTEMTGEIMDDLFDDAFEGDNEAEEDEIVNQVLDEFGISLSGDLLTAPDAPVTQGQAEASKPQPVAASEEDDAAVNDLEARLNNLRRGG